MGGINLGGMYGGKVGLKGGEGLRCGRGDVEGWGRGLGVIEWRDIWIRPLGLQPLENSEFNVVPYVKYQTRQYKFNM